MKKSKFIFSLLICFHALWMIFLTYIWVNQPYSYGSETSIMTATSIVKNIVLGVQKKPSKDSVLFINISYDKMLVPRFDAEGFESGKIAITDRNTLAKFFEISALNPNYKGILLDYFSEDSTSLDSALQAQLDKHRMLIMPYHYDGGTKKLESNFKGWTGLADYTTDFGKFLKYTYIQKDSSRTVPLELYRKLYKSDIKKTGPFYTSQNRLALNAVSLDFPIRTYDIFTNDSMGYPSVHLCELINLPPPFIHELTKGKLIIIGDFLDRDIHETLYGSIAGPLIHYNGYLALVNGDHLISWYLLLFLFFNYALLSYFLFSDTLLFRHRWLKIIQESKFGGVVLDFVKYAMVLLMINVFSYILFNIHLNVLLLGLYVLAIDYIRSWVIKYQIK